jgi:dTDP-4-dehydrorhamnose 3,5-epimerase
MIFKPTKLSGAYIIEPERHEDARGFFARTFCAREFEEHGLVGKFVQSSVSATRLRGTVRGMHCQLPPACEVKLVRCTSGGIYDVIVDLRKDSSTYLQHMGVELTAENGRALYVPEMFAHGFQALENDAVVFYQISEFYAPATAIGLRYNDPKLAIQWPLPVSMVGDKDLNWPLLS